MTNRALDEFDWSSVPRSSYAGPVWGEGSGVLPWKEAEAKAWERYLEHRIKPMHPELQSMFWDINGTGRMNLIDPDAPEKHGSMGHYFPDPSGGGFKVWAYFQLPPGSYDYVRANALPDAESEEAARTAIENWIVANPDARRGNPERI